jgi:hypothetical protein
MLKQAGFNGFAQRRARGKRKIGGAATSNDAADHQENSGTKRTGNHIPQLPHDTREMPPNAATAEQTKRMKRHSSKRSLHEKLFRGANHGYTFLIGTGRKNLTILQD